MKRGLLFFLGFSAVAAGIAEWPLHGEHALDDSNVAFTLAAAFAVASTWRSVRRCAPRELRTWMSLALASGAWLGGQLVWDWYTWRDLPVPTPSVADGMWLAFPLLTAVGVYRFAPVVAHVRRVLDLDAFALAVGTAGLTVAVNWNAIERSSLSIAGRVTTVAYPVTYAVVVALGAGALVGTPAVLRRRDLMLVYAGLVCEGVGFGLWCPEVLSQTYRQGASALDAMWVAGLVLIGLGALDARSNPEPVVYPPDRLRRRTLVPACAFAALIAVPFVLATQGAPLAPRLAVFGAIGAVGFVLVARSWLAFAAVEHLEAERREALALRNRELEAFAYSASHDLKAPLVSIAGFAGMLERSLGERLSEEDAYYLQRIAANADGLQRLIADLFAFARSGGDERDAERVDTTAIAAELLAELGDRAAERGMTLVVDAPLPAVRAHPVRLKQALTNLVDNALRYGGGDVRVSGRDEGGVAEIVVEDGGDGVPADERDRIFDVFARGAAARLSAPEGTGLGLALVKRIVEASGGAVRYEHAAGARFVLTFPEAGL